MPKIIDKEDRKENITLRMSKYVNDFLRTIPNYNNLVEEILKRELNITKKDE